MEADYHEYIHETRYSAIDEFDVEKWPLLRKARTYEKVIGPGEALFIPAGWWHWVFSEETDEKSGLNFAVNFWFWESKPKPLEPIVSTHDISFKPDRLPSDKKVTVTFSRDNRFGSNTISKKSGRQAIRKEMTWGEFLRNCHPYSYVVQDPLDDQGITAPDHPDFLKVKTVSLWANFGNVSTYMHWDSTDNWLCQIHGKKRVLLFHSSDFEFLYSFNRYPILNVSRLISKEYMISIVPLLEKEFVQYIFDEILKNNERVILSQELALKNDKNAYKMFDSFKIRFLGSLGGYESEHGRISTRYYDDFTIEETSQLPNIFVSLSDTVISIKGNSKPIRAGDIIMFPKTVIFPVYCCKGPVKIIH